MAPGTVLAPHAAERAATTGAAALDLTSVATPAAETLKGAKTLNGRARTRMRPGAAPAAAPSSRWPVYAGAAAVVGVIVVGAALAVKARLAPTATPAPADVTTEQVGALKEALVGNQVELARVDLENKDYKAAITRAERALVLDPASTEARQVLDQAQRTAAELDAVALEARRAFAAGDTNHATRALARVLALDPRHPVAGELTAALNVHFRKQAEDARRMADDARREAEPLRAGATDGSGFAQADRIAREASALLRRDSSRSRRRSSWSRATATSGPGAPRRRRRARPPPPPPGPRHPRRRRATCPRPSRSRRRLRPRPPCRRPRCPPLPPPSRRRRSPPSAR